MYRELDPLEIDVLVAKMAYLRAEKAWIEHTKPAGPGRDLVVADVIKIIAACGYKLGGRSEEELTKGQSPATRESAVDGGDDGGC